MFEEQVYFTVKIDELVAKAEDIAQEGYRLIQILCRVKNQKEHLGFEEHENQQNQADQLQPKELQMIYSFENEDLRLINLRLEIVQGQEIPSISGVFLPAFLYENEIHDLFGVTVQGMAVDFQGKLYQTAIRAPFNQAPSSSER